METFDIPYYPENRHLCAHGQERCRLDIRGPEEGSACPVLVWFHGGGLTGEQKSFPSVKESKLVQVAAGYRLAPHASPEEILADAAAAVAWVFNRIQDYGGNPKKIFIGGYSAGGYLAAMAGMDPRWLSEHGISIGQPAGIILVSAQVTTHFMIKELRGTHAGINNPLIDPYAPLFHISKNLPPVFLMTGDRAMDIPGRAEENHLLAASLRALGHPSVEMHEMKGCDHAAMDTFPDDALHWMIRSALL